MDSDPDRGLPELVWIDIVVAVGREIISKRLR